MSTPWARLFFVAVYICGPLVLINIIIAAIMDAFLQYIESGESGKPGAASADAESDEAAGPDGAIIDASNLSGTATGLEGQYRAFVSHNVPRTQHASLLQRWLGVNS